ncbi:TetR/AcrR family transcriptional regulator [Leifsonia sp. McL0607]|uniref:TetR/AcrR family transcriptional regulator n=1 Tax=Leifsonia sp. McL0607 TaxID=3415672 RepID=UPI003CF88705
MGNESLGLRERKRLETRAQLERAAVLLASDVGLENATVEAICATVPVSVRTFFNYFESKEDAILGVREFELDEQSVERHVRESEGRPLAERVIALLLESLAPAIADTRLHEARMAIIKQHPELLGRQVAQMSRAGERLVAATAAILAHDSRFAPLGADEQNTTAELILPLCGGAVRLAVKEWVSAGGERSLPQLQRRAVELVGKVISTLS